MTAKQRSILHLFNDGKTHAEICASLGMERQSLYQAVYRMRLAGIKMDDRLPTGIKAITPAQRKVLEYYCAGIPVPQIAAEMGVTCQTVQNTAFNGFARLGLTRIGEDRFAIVRKLFGMEEKPALDSALVVTMDDPFFS